MMILEWTTGPSPDVRLNPIESIKLNRILERATCSNVVLILSVMFRRRAARAVDQWPVSGQWPVHALILDDDSLY